MNKPDRPIRRAAVESPALDDRCLTAFQSTAQHMFREGGGQPAIRLRRAAPALHGGRREALLIEASLADAEALAAGARAGMEVAAYGGCHDGLAQLVRWAAVRDRYDAVHLMCHGAPGRLMLGTRILDTGALDHAAVRDALAAIGMALRPGGCVLLYACDVAQGRAGADFVAALACACGVHVLAATGRVGAPAQGGSWELDHATGPVSATPLAWPDYSHTLTVAPTGVQA